uniref:Uncharacterized protein n=1 Tax=Setaria viridis TaxID=4556 RepID=A0A4U6U318_SETVI|nr:hypothetical protein SEVIR_7G325650v2 [Setaria viridis]
MEFSKPRAEEGGGRRPHHCVHERPLASIKTTRGRGLPDVDSWGSDGSSPACPQDRARFCTSGGRWSRQGSSRQHRWLLRVYVQRHRPAAALVCPSDWCARGQQRTLGRPPPPRSKAVQ